MVAVDYHHNMVLSYPRVKESEAQEGPRDDPWNPDLDQNKAQDNNDA